MRELIAARDWLTVYQLPLYAHQLGPVELVWSHADELRAVDPDGFRAVLEILRDAERATSGTERPLTVRLTPGR